jgi:hypothetical protein
VQRLRQRDVAAIRERGDDQSGVNVTIFGENNWRFSSKIILNYFRYMSVKIARFLFFRYKYFSKIHLTLDPGIRASSVNVTILGEKMAIFF